MTEPYETEREAREAARHITDSPPGSWQDSSHRLLEEACAAAGVKLGAYDHRILVWLAGWEPATCAVVAGLITRAHAGALTGGQWALVADALADASRWRDFTGGEDCRVCSASPAGVCEAHAEDLDADARYRELAREMGGQR